MSKSTEVATVTALETCPQQITEQFVDFLGDDFNPSVLTGNIRKKLFPAARAVIRSFAADTTVSRALGEVSKEVDFSSACIVNPSLHSEIAQYRLLVDDTNDREKPKEAVRIELSPNAYKILFQPVSSILSGDIEADPNQTASEIRDTALQITNHALYSGVVAQYFVKRHAMSEVGNLNEAVLSKVDYLYEQTYGKDRLKDPATRLHRLAMSIGGTVMLRQAAEGINNTIPEDAEMHTQQIGFILKMYIKGLARSRIVDQHQVRFPLTRAFTPPQASRFLKAWFTPPDTNPVLRVVR